jgi:hypothetical protein
MAEKATLNFTEQPLSPEEVRAIGALVEKAATTPDNYPLSLRALTVACNQSSNRDPVLALEEEQVAEAVRGLIDRGLVRDIYRSDSRVKRYRHTLADTLHLHEPEQAALCVLMLRGPQTAGEIKARTGRMFEFVDPAHVEITLESLAGLAIPLVTRLPRQPGQKEPRYAQLLAGEPAVEEAAPAAEAPSHTGRTEALEDEVRGLREELAALREAFEAFRREFR